MIYNEPVRERLKDTFTQQLVEINDRFAEKDFHIFGPGHSDVLSEDVLFQEYKEALLENMPSDEADTLGMLIDNNRLETLSESINSGIVPVTSLSLPTLRKTWPKLAMPHVIPTTPAQRPKFTITYMHPWVRRSKNAEKTYVPDNFLRDPDLNSEGDEFDGSGEELEEFQKPRFYFGESGSNRTTFIEFASTSGAVSNLVTKDKYSVVHATDSGFPASVAKVDDDIDSHIDADVEVRRLKLQVKTLSEPSTNTVNDGYWSAVTEVTATLKTPVIMDTRTGIVRVVIDSRTSFSDLTLASGQPHFKDALFINVDRAGKEITILREDSGATTTVETDEGDSAKPAGTLGQEKDGSFISAVELITPVSTQLNQEDNVETVGFDILDQEINIPEAQHLAAPIPNEYLTDLLRLYDVDGVSKIVEIMSQVIAQRTDHEGIEFFEALQKRLIPDPGKYETKPCNKFFDVLPPSAFHGSPTEWRNEVRIVIDNLAQELLNRVKFDSGYFVLFGNPIDIQIIPNVQWMFESGGEERYGVPVTYQVGRAKSVYDYRIVASTNMPKKKIHMIFIPTLPEQATYKMFPYSFTVNNGNGYKDPNHPTLPAIVSHRRYKYEYFVPCQGVVRIHHNDGLLAYNETHVSPRA